MSNIHNDLEPTYRKQPLVWDTCRSNSVYPDETSMTFQRNVIFPTTKSLYTGIPNYYPFQTINQPLNTLYGSDNSLFNDHGKRLTFQRKPYPKTGWSPKEHRFYSNETILYPRLDEFTRYPIQTSTSINTGLKRVTAPESVTPIREYKFL